MLRPLPSVKPQVLASGLRGKQLRQEPHEVGGLITRPRGFPHPCPLLKPPWKPP